MAKIEQKVLTTPTFINGSLQPAGAIVSVDMDQFQPTAESTDPENGTKNPTPNLADIGEAAVLVATPMAAIAPTGPNPTAPQQIPPGSMQTLEGYAHGGALLVGEGSELAAEAARGEGAAALNEGVEEEAVARLNATAQGAGTAGAGTNGSETGNANPQGTGEPFNGETFIDRTLDAITDDEIAGLSDADRAAVIRAEQDRERPRVGLLTRLGVSE